MTMTDTAKPTSHWTRFLPLAAIAVAMAAAYGFGLHRYLSLQSLAENRAVLRGFTADNLALSLLIYMLIYVVAVALSIPGAVILTITGGLLFGWLVGGAVTVLAATIGAIILFLVAKSALGESLVNKAGPALTRLKDGFAEDAFNYLLFLRLVPAFPFWLVNIAPALANVKLRTFALATAIGIIPGTFAFSFVGQGLDSIIAAQSTAHDACVAEGGGSLPI